jgi:hypothetical protein
MGLEQKQMSGLDQEQEDLNVCNKLYEAESFLGSQQSHSYSTISQHLLKR